jgi:hypothetical protein
MESFRATLATLAFFPLPDFGNHDAGELFGHLLKRLLGPFKHLSADTMTWLQRSLDIAARFLAPFFFKGF